MTDRCRPLLAGERGVNSCFKQVVGCPPRIAVAIVMAGRVRVHGALLNETYYCILRVNLAANATKYT